MSYFPGPNNDPHRCHRASAHLWVHTFTSPIRRWVPPPTSHRLYATENKQWAVPQPGAGKSSWGSLPLLSLLTNLQRIVALQETAVSTMRPAWYPDWGWTRGSHQRLSREHVMVLPTGAVTMAILSCSQMPCGAHPWPPPLHALGQVMGWGNLVDVWGQQGQARQERLSGAQEGRSQGSRPLRRSPEGRKVAGGGHRWAEPASPLHVIYCPKL